MGTMMEDMTTPLTPIEVQILTHIARGNSNKLIGNILGFSQSTIKNHVTSILRKMNANYRAHAVLTAGGALFAVRRRKRGEEAA